MSCSRHSCAIDLGPRSDASTISVFCCTLNLRYLRVSLNGSSRSVEQPSSDPARTEPHASTSWRSPLKERSRNRQQPIGVRATLAYNAEYSASEARACVRALGIIGSPEALE